MSRRTLFKVNPPPEIKTQFVAPNESRAPEIAPRRRGIHAEIAGPIGELAMAAATPVIEKRETLTLKKRGRPPHKTE